MSLWLQSLTFSLNQSKNDFELKAKCILSHLSMDIPRSWWEQALVENNVRNSHAKLIHDLRNELLTTSESEPIGKIDTGLLIALAYIDKQGEFPKFGSSDSPYSVEEYLANAKKNFESRPELKKIANLIDNDQS